MTAVDNILKGFTKPLKQLEKLAGKLDHEANAAAVRVLVLQSEVNEKEAEAAKARAVITNLSAFLESLSKPPAKAD